MIGDEEAEEVNSTPSRLKGPFVRQSNQRPSRSHEPVPDYSRRSRRPPRSRSGRRL